MLLVTIALIVLTGWLYVVIPKGFLPEQDTGMIMGQAQAREDIAFEAMTEIVKECAAIIQQGSCRLRRRQLRRRNRRQRDREHGARVHAAQALQ